MSWFYSRDLKPQGPHDLQHMRDKILRGEIGPADLVYNEQVDQWLMAMEWREFEQSLFPAFQAVDMESLAQEWVILKEVQEGPYSLPQIYQMLAAQKISLGHYIWKTGLSGWVQVKDRPEVISLMRKASQAEAELKV